MREKGASFRFARYRFAPVLVVRRLQDSAFCLGLIVLGKREYDRCQAGRSETLNHEYGHFLQMLLLGLPVYLGLFAIPSFICYWTRWLEGHYYSLPWEYTADIMGKAKNAHDRRAAIWGWGYFALCACLTIGIRCWIALILWS